MITKAPDLDKLKDVVNGVENTGTNDTLPAPGTTTDVGSPRVQDQSLLDGSGLAALVLHLIHHQAERVIDRLLAAEVVYELSFGPTSVHPAEAGVGDHRFLLIVLLEGV